MSDSYEQLLAATIEHLQNLKSRGVRFVSVSEKNLTALEKTPRRPAPKTQSPVSAPDVVPQMDSAKAVAFEKLRERVM
ncbi:MAG TPA: hypothetical protein VFM25_12530, partial [Verrucomicrobiae bacterium]|nr:hypothetical protein [Verrucomicrobiae bacterium]